MGPLRRNLRLRCIHRQAHSDRELIPSCRTPLSLLKTRHPCRQPSRVPPGRAGVGLFSSTLPFFFLSSPVFSASTPLVVRGSVLCTLKRKFPRTRASFLFM